MPPKTVISLKPDPIPDEPEPGWSPTLSAFRRTIRAPVCSVCRVQEGIHARYLHWLSEEVVQQETKNWFSALWLCPKHAWNFTRVAREEAVARLVTAIRAHWRHQLGDLAEFLEEPPGASPWSLLFLERQRQLAEKRKQALREGDCPVCRALETATKRHYALLEAGLGDPGTRRAYEEGSGFCFHHLSETLGQEADRRSAEFLLQAAAAHLSVLSWELAEFLRKQNWSVRYEKAGPEQEVARRAVAQYSGNWLD